MSRRQLLGLIGLAGGSAVMYQAMASLGFAAESSFTGFPKLGSAPRGASVLVLGAGVAGMVAALELRDAGYRVQVLEYNGRPGGRVWTLRGGDRYTELGGATQDCGFAPGQYINPGPWRLPHHHHGILGYCRRLGVAVENFVQVNYNALLHDPVAFAGKPQRLRTIKADYQGQIAELLAKASRGGSLDARVTAEDQEKLLESLQWWGALDKDYAYTGGHESNDRRGFAKAPGGGPAGAPRFSTPIKPADVLQSGLWGFLPLGELYDMQSTLMQPVGGMDAIAHAFGRELGDTIRYRARVLDIRQDERGVTATYEDTEAPGTTASARADWCICTIPLSILGQIPMNVGRPMADAIGAIPYAGATKVGLQFKRRFWEEDEHIYGGISYTSQPIGTIGYPSHGYQSAGKAVLLGAYVWGHDADRFNAMSPEQRVAEAVQQGSRLHPQYPREFDGGVAVSWHRVPSAMGCFALWTEALREQHYANLCAFDGRILLAGEHASYQPAWQEGAVNSALDAITRLHQRAVASGANA
jgi:monoamine oxidase